MEIGIMEIGFPFMGDRLSLCRYSWAKRLTVYSFIFSFSGFPFPDIHIHLYQQLQQWLRGLLFLKSLAGCLFVALLPMMRFIRHHSLQQPVFLLAALRLMLPNTLAAASSYKMSGVCNVGGYCCCCIIFCSVFFEFI
ncbi:Uncharacterised protein [Citrobacter freundii]|nr:Uncharacterised protein [Citrobacter freundii]